METIWVPIYSTPINRIYFKWIIKQAKRTLLDIIITNLKVLKLCNHEYEAVMIKYVIIKKISTPLCMYYYATLKTNKIYKSSKLGIPLHKILYSRYI